MCLCCFSVIHSLSLLESMFLLPCSNSNNRSTATPYLAVALLVPTAFDKWGQKICVILGVERLLVSDGSLHSKDSLHLSMTVTKCYLESQPQSLIVTEKFVNAWLSTRGMYICGRVHKSREIQVGLCTCPHLRPIGAPVNEPKRVKGRPIENKYYTTDAEPTKISVIISILWYTNSSVICSNR